MTENLTEKFFDALDIDKLRSTLKGKCRNIQNLEDKIQKFYRLIKMTCRSI